MPKLTVPAPLARLVRRAPPPPPPPWPQQLAAMAERFLVDHGVPVARLRQGYHDLGKLRPAWPLLLPVLAWVFVRTYRRERAAAGERVA